MRRIYEKYISSLLEKHIPLDHSAALEGRLRDSLPAIHTRRILHQKIDSLATFAPLYLLSTMPRKSSNEWHRAYVAII